MHIVVSYKRKENVYGYVCEDPKFIAQNHDSLILCMMFNLDLWK